MIYIVHGDNALSSRDFVIGLQKRLASAVRREGDVSDVSPQQLEELCMSLDVLGDAAIVILDVSRAGRMKLDPYVSVLENVPDDATVVIFSEKELPASSVFLKNASKLEARVVRSRPAKTSNVFSFIDFVFSGNRNMSYKELRKLIVAGEDPFSLFSMLLYGLRNVAYVKLDAPEVSKMAPFVRSKASAQAANFSRESLLRLFEDFYNLDKKVKTGAVSSDLLIPLAIEKTLYNIKCHSSNQKGM